ncbi:MAG: folate-binding protein YgfZ [Burkholderiales bacterium]|nr:folate-binding protein YgfZ [Burkholderiales bacterium]
MHAYWQDVLPPFSFAPRATQFDAVARGGFVCALDDTGLIEVSGTDAATFLHNQLTNDIENLPADCARRAGYCSPKGRLLATFLAWRQSESVFLAVAADVQAAVQKRLGMFVLRAKAKLSDATPDHVVLALGGAGADAALGRYFDTLPADALAIAQNAHGTLIRLPDAAGQVRYQWIVPVAEASGAWAALGQQLQPVEPAVARWLDVRTGVPWIGAATQEQFVPQMINWEVVDGVNFRKGCYPGQEIVARSQYRGTIKRRLYLAHTETEAAPAMELFQDGDQPCGMVVNAAPAPGGGSDCLVELQVAAHENGVPVRLGAPGGAMLRFSELPYALPNPLAADA